MILNATCQSDDALGASRSDQTRRQYLLMCQAESDSLESGRWYFHLESCDGADAFSAGDEDVGDLNRLILLAAVRGLEAIDGPAAVTLLSHSRYLIRSLVDSLPRWRDNGFVWEHFGRRIDVQHADLWRRIDRALTIHRVEACLVSSRLVSAGNGLRDLDLVDPAEPSRQQGDSRRWQRVDSPHDTIAGHHIPSDAAATSSTADHLRKWLVAGGGPNLTARRQRFTAADLMQSA